MSQTKSNLAKLFEMVRVNIFRTPITDENEVSTIHLDSLVFKKVTLGDFEFQCDFELLGATIEISTGVGASLRFLRNEFDKELSDTVTSHTQSIDQSTNVHVGGEVKLTNLNPKTVLNAGAESTRKKTNSQETKASNPLHIQFEFNQDSKIPNWIIRSIHEGTTITNEAISDRVIARVKIADHDAHKRVATDVYFRVYCHRENIHIPSGSITKRGKPLPINTKNEQKALRILQSALVEKLLDYPRDNSDTSGKWFIADFVIDEEHIE